jgi:hypothetical protein
MGWEACTRYGERRSVNRILVVKPEGKRPLCRHRPRFEDNIKMDHQEVGCGGIDFKSICLRIGAVGGHL